ncbi:putative glycoside hydrolase [Thermithiobacillus plumbiphilus]|uniref:Glycoside hydrolase n=1 Tax=Thermithiobacillus plumbiphilus TaxID=1729899 RepID=A0ABU9DCV2_9PROT
MNKISLMVAGALLAGGMSMDASAYTHDYPRVMGMVIGNKAYDNAALQQQISRADVAILGFYPGWKSGYSYGGYTGMRAAVKALKAKNPNLLVGQYTILNEMQNNTSGADGDKARKLNQENWWLRNASGGMTAWTSAYNAYETNMSSHTRTDAQGKRWPQWLAERDYNKFFKAVPEMDVWYFDNVFDRPRVTADWNLDRRNDSARSSLAISAIRNGHVAEWNRAKQLRPNAMLVSNADSDLSMPEYKGKMQGNFLEGQMGKSWSIINWAGWDKMMARYNGAMANTTGPKLVGFNVWGSPYNFKLFRFGLTSTLMNNGYYSYTDQNKGYGSLPWFDEYDVSLGQPTQGVQTSPWSKGVYRRLFQKGMVLVNPTGSNVTVNVGYSYKRIAGRQDRSVNNGQAVNGNITIPAKDGIILVKR